MRLCIRAVRAQRRPVNVSVGHRDQDMTRAELADHFQAMGRCSWWIFGPWLVAFMGILWLFPRLVPQEVLDKPMSTAGLIGFFSFLFLNLAGIFFVYYRLMRRYGIVCSHCNKVLDNEGLALALSIGVCNRCKAQFLHD